MTNVKTDTNAHPKTGESGATMVQAAIILPLFMAVLLGSIRILVISYQGIRLQHEVSETMRMTFTLERAARGNRTWADYFAATLWSRLRNTGLALGFGGTPIAINQGAYSLYYLKAGSTQPLGGWPGADAVPGETFSITIRSQEPLFSTKLAGISSPTIELRAKAVAVINRAEDE